MMTKKERKDIKALHTKKGRLEQKRCLVEGENALEMAAEFIESRFTKKDVLDFAALVTSKTPHGEAGIAYLPTFTKHDIHKKNHLLVLDGVQDPGNVGTLFRLAFAFDAAVLLVGGADPVSPKVIRSSTGTMFLVPWIQMESEAASEYLAECDRQISRLERTEKAVALNKTSFGTRTALVLGAEGNGIQMKNSFNAESVYIPHSTKLDSLNVATAASMALWEIHR